MQKMFGETTLEPLEKRRDKELTLGPTTLLLLALGLFGLCGVCFVFGYAVGQHGAPVNPAERAQLSAAGSGSTPQTSASSVKPAPSQNSFQAKQTAAPVSIIHLRGTPRYTPRTITAAPASAATA